MATKILVVDDDAALRDMLTFRLQASGYEVASAADGIEAMEKVKSSRPDVLLLDIMLPGKHGYEICQTLRADKSLQTMKIIFISAKGYAADIKNSKKLGADEYLIKPFEHKDLLAAIGRVLAPQP